MTLLEKQLDCGGKWCAKKKENRANEKNVDEENHSHTAISHRNGMMNGWCTDKKIDIANWSSIWTYTIWISSVCQSIGQIGWFKRLSINLLNALECNFESTTLSSSYSLIRTLAHAELNSLPFVMSTQICDLCLPRCITIHCSLAAFLYANNDYSVVPSLSHCHCHWTAHRMLHTASMSHYIISYINSLDTHIVVEFLSFRYDWH